MSPRPVQITATDGAEQRGTLRTEEMRAERSWSEQDVRVAAELRPKHLPPQLLKRQFPEHGSF